MNTVQEAVEEADLFLSVGTSGMVYPAAGLVEVAQIAGAYTVELNLESSVNTSLFDEAIHGPATKVVRQYIEHLLSSG